MKYVLSALTLLASLVAANAQNVSTGRLGVTPSADPEPVFVLDKSNVWNQIGTMTGGAFTPVPSTATGNVNILQWNSVPVGPATAAGIIGTGNYPNINAFLTSAGLATAAAPTFTEGQPAAFSFDRSGGLRVSGGNQAPAAFTPDNSYATPLSVSNVSASIALPASAVVGSVVRIYNRGPSNIFYQLGNSSVAATLANTPVALNCWDSVVVKSGQTNIAAITGASGLVSTVNVESGTGPPRGGCGPVNSSVFSSTGLSGVSWTNIGATDNASHTAPIQATAPGTAPLISLLGVQGAPNGAPIPTLFPGTATPGTGGTSSAGTMPYVNSYYAGGGPMPIVWPGTATVGVGGATSAGTMPYVNAYVVGSAGSSVTQAPGSVSAGAYVDGAIVTMGAQADAAWSGSGAASEIAILKKIATAPAGNVFQATAFNQGTASAAATTQVFALSGTTIIYLVNYGYQTDAGATGNGTFQIVSGTGTNCQTIRQTLTPLWNFAQNAGISEGSIGVLNASQAGDALCVVTTTNQKVNWRIGIAQQ